MIHGLSRSRRRGRALAAWALYVGALLALPSLASADHNFLPEYWITPAPQKEGEVVPTPLFPQNALTGYPAPPAKTFDDACGLAVDNEQAIYIADHYHDVIDRFRHVPPPSPQPVPPTVPPWGSWSYDSQTKDADPLGSPCGVAWSPAGLYVNDYRRGVFWYHNSEGTEIDSGPATGVAVDLTTDWVYVTHPTFVAVYEADGTPVDDESAKPLHIGLGSLGEAYGVAVSKFPATKGYVYVADAADETVKVFNPAASITTPIEMIDGSLGPQQGFRDLRDSSLAIDQANGSLFVVDRLAEAEEPPMVVDEFTPGGNFRGQLEQQRLSDGEPAAVAVNPTTRVVYVTTGRRDHAGVYAFAAAGPTHAVLTHKAGTGEGTVTTEPVGISCPASCAAGEAEFDTGSVVVLNAASAPHSSFSGWTVSGHPGACPGTEPCQLQMLEDMEVTANFAAIPQQNLTVSLQGDGEGTVTSEPAGIECGTSCTEHFDEGSTVTLTASPALRSHFAGWSVAGKPSACSGTGPCEVTLDQAIAVTAKFAHNPDRTLSVAVSGQGTVVSTPAGVSCPTDCAHAFPDGSSVVLQPVPAPGYELVSWSGACSGKRGCTAQMDEDRSISATFVLIEDALAVSVIGTGSGTVSDTGAGIDCGLTCAGIYKHGSVLTLTAAPEAGSRFLGFVGCDSVAGQTCTVTVDEAKTVTAVFGEAPEISVRRAVAHGRKIVLSVSVPSPGLLEAHGKDIVAKKLRVDAQGFATLRLSLSARGARRLRKADEGKLSIRVSLLFTSADGSTASAKKIVTLRRKGRR
jgi:hypothetical protein